MTDQNTTFVSVTLDPESEARLVRSLTEAFNKAFASAATQMEELTARMTRSAAEAIKVIQGSAGKMGKEFKAVGTEANTAFSGAEKHIIALVNHMLEAEHATGVVIRELANLSIAERRQGINAGQAASDAARLQIAEVRNVGIQTNIEGQKAVVVARGAAKSRVLITQGMVRSIILLEKGIGATIQGVAKTTVAAIGKIFSGLGGLLRKGNSSVDTEMRRTSQAVERGMRKTNTEFNTGLNGALNKRESALRSSFRDQEQIITKSALRQKETLAGLRTGTQTGVLGAANRGLNIGSLVGGIAILSAVRSTFSIGSEFTRGMAVLQAQLNLTGDEMKKVRQLSIDLGNDITLPGVSALDASEAIQLLAKQFAALGPAAITAAQDAAKGTLQLSRAAGVGAEEAAGIVGAAVNVFGIEASKATDVADQVTAALKNAAGVSFGDFADAFKQAGAVFAQFQKPAVGATEALLEFDTALAVIARSGVIGSDAGTSLKQFFLQANRSAPAAQNALTDLTKRAGETGTAFFDAAGKARPFEKTLDILRKGLVGLTDQQRTSALQTIFGSDAIRVANALLSTSTEEYAKVTQSLREQGLASKIAAAQNTGLKGALDALKSVFETVQILLFEKVNPALGKFVLGIAAAVNVVLFGKGAWADLRIALLGVAAGIGSILAIKGVIELFQQLSRVVALVLTPLGAFIFAAALVGGAVALLLKHSESFRETVVHLKERLVEFAGVAKERVVTALHNIRDVIVRDVIPFLQELGEWVGKHLVSALHTVVDFMMNTVIPALKTAGEFIGRIASIGFRAVVDFIEDHVIPTFKTFVQYVITNVVPVAIRIGEIFKGAFDTALEAVKGFWHTVEPILRPALEGFKTLGRAIAAIFTGGDFSQLGKGFSAVGSGITTSFSTIGKNLLGVLDRLWITLQTWFKEHFTGAKLIDLGKGFLDLVEFIGNTLGKIVTSPTFVRAVALLAAGLAAAAVLVAGRFIEGFGKALLDHLPGLFKLVGGAILDGFVAIFHNPLIATGIALAIFAIFRVINLVKGFTKLGQDAGGGFTNGLKASFKGVKAQNNFLTSFFGGPQRVTRTYFEGLNKAFNTELGGVQKKLRALGSTTIVTPRTFDAAKKELRLIGSGFDDAAVKGLLARDTFKQVGAGVATAFRGLRQGIVGGIKGVVKGVGDALSATNAYNGPATSGGKAFASAFRDSVRGSGKTIAAGLSGLGVALQETAAAQGKSVGAVLGSALAKAAIGAVAAVGGFQAGKAEGASGGSGILSALLTGVTAGTLTGSPIIGVVAAGATLLGAAFGRAQAAAKAFKEEVQNLAGSFKDDLVNAIKSGQIAVDNLDFGHIINLPGVGDQVSNQILEDLKKKNALSAFDQAGLTIPVDVLPLIKAADGDVNKFERDFQKRLFEGVANEAEFKKLFGAGIQASGVQDVLSRALLNGSDAQRRFANDVLHTKEAITGANSVAIASTKVSAEEARVIGVVDKAERDLALHRQTSAGKPNPFFNFSEGIKAAIPLLRKAQGESAMFALAEAKIGKTAEEIQVDLAKVGLPPIPQEIIDQWTSGLDAAKTHAEALQKVVDAIPGSIAKIGQTAVATPGQLVQDAAVVQVKADTSGFVQAVTDSVNHDFDTPEVRLALAQLGDGVSTAISTAITSGNITSNADLLTFIQPLLDSALAAANTPEEKERIKQLFADIFAGVSVELPKDVIDVGMAKFAADVNQFLIDNPFTTKINAEFQVAHKNDPNFLQGHGLTADFNPTTTANLLGLPTVAQVDAAAQPIGKAVPLGLTKGMKDPEAVAAMKAQVRSLANQALAQFKLTLGIKSPSTEMAKLGGFMTQGLADGITAGASAASTAATAAAQAAVDAAKGVITDNPIPLPVSAQVPPQANIISGAEHDRLRALSVGRGVVGSAVQGTPAGQIDIGQAIASLAHFGSKITPGDDTGAGALQAKQELADLVTLARALVAAAEQMNKRGPDQTNLTIVEAKDARATGRAAIAEMRADRMLLKGIR